MFASAAKRLLPSDVYRYLVANAALLLTAPRVAKPRQKAPRAESSIGLDLAERFEGRETLTYQEAVATLVALAQELADKPPPTPEEADSTGLAGSTYRPTLDYLAQVHTYGADAVAPEVHASMARMLELHKKQLNYRIMPVLDALDTSIQEEVVRQGRVAAPRSGKGSLKIYSPDEESFTKLGQYRWNARNRTLEVETSYELYKGGFRIAQALAAQGLEKGVHFVWRERWIEGRYARKVLYLEVKPEYVEEVAHALEQVAPEFARALLANAEIWRQRAGVTRKEPKAAQPSTEIELTAAVLQDGNSSEEGTIAVPEGMERKFHWSWNPSNPETVTLRLPTVWTDGSRVPLASALIEQSGIPAQRGAREEGYPVTVQVLPFAKVARLLLESGKFPGTVEALKVLYPIWKAAASKTNEQRAVTVTAEERKMAATLARRFQHMMGGQRSTPEVQEQLAAAIPLLRGVQPGATSADLGLYGSWRVDSTPDPKHPKVPIRTLVIRLASYPTMEVLSGLLGARFRKAGSAYELGVALKRAPAVARALDEPNPVLAMSLRLGLLTDSAVKSCHELEILSSALTLQDIPDDGLRTQVQQIERQLDLKALITDADGRKHTARPSPYQTIGMAFAHFAGGRALIADVPGLGKTLQAIGFMLFEDAFPALVVCPATAVWNWVTEIKRWTDRPLEIIVVETATDPIPDVKGKRAVIVVSADMMRRVADALVNRQLRLVVFDEAHYFKNSASQRAEAAKRVAHNTPMVLLLSGTALENRVPDLWHLLHMLDPRGFPTLAAFKAKYANANKRSIEAIDPDTGEIQLMEYDDDRRSTSLDELRDTLRCIMVRRLKNEVLTDLPLKTRIVHQLKGLDLRAYHKAEAEMAELMVAYARRDRIAEAAKRVGAGEDIDEVAQEINARDFTNPVKYIIVVLNRLRQLAGEAKAGAAAAWALEFLRTKRRPLVIFVEHQPVLQVLGEALSAEGIRWTYIDGVVPGKERFKRVNEFQDGKYEVIICTKAAREAITLTRARDELFVEFWWVPAWMEQAEDRIHRRGQTGEVTINYLEAPNTTDAHIRELIIEKQADIEKVMRADDYEESDEAAKVEAPITEIMAKEMLRRIEDRVQIGSTAGLDFTAEDVEDAMATVEDDKPKRKRRKKQ